jgi:hypothetical protein
LLWEDSSITDPYKVLGVDVDATQAEIHRRYLALAKKWHPDLNADNKAAEIKFKEIASAWKLLSNVESRRLYDSSQARYTSMPYEEYRGYGQSPWKDRGYGSTRSSNWKPPPDWSNTTGYWASRPNTTIPRSGNHWFQNAFWAVATVISLALVVPTVVSLVKRPSQPRKGDTRPATATETQQFSEAFHKEAWVPARWDDVTGKWFRAHGIGAYSGEDPTVSMVPSSQVGETPEHIRKAAQAQSLAEKTRLYSQKKKDERRRELVATQAVASYKRFIRASTVAEAPRQGELS